jgi:hypothetical protein
MNPLFLHIGMPKTGTTSIQSTLFWTPPADPFRFITLDTDFGNQVLVGAFTHDFQTSDRYFASLVRKRDRKRFSVYAKNYLDFCLKQCKKIGATPILSAESVWQFPSRDLQSLKSFAQSHGFSVRVVGYLRPPLDYTQSLFQQRIKNARSCCIADALRVVFEIPGIIATLDDVFGRGNVHLFPFVPSALPENCVVQHFYQTIGLDFHKSFVRRENESMNLNALKFLYAWRDSKVGKHHGTLTRIRCRILLDNLQSLEGPPVRFHSSLFEDVRGRFDKHLSEIEKRIQHQLPWTVSPCPTDDGLTSDSDLWMYSDEALQWLSNASSLPCPRPNTPSETITLVAKRLNRLCNRPSLVTFSKHLQREFRIRVHRQSRISNLRKHDSVSA